MSSVLNFSLQNGPSSAELEKCEIWNLQILTI